MKHNRWKIISFIAILLFCGIFQVFAQTQSENSDGILALDEKTLLARSSADYRVTAGDVYSLSFAIGNNPIVYTISVDTSYRIRVANLGIVNAAGRTFVQLRNEVEAIVTNNYPLSGVQLILIQPATFNVYVTGEVQNAVEVPVWALNRLSFLTSENLTALTSLRDVQIRSSNGQIRVFDLYRAQRLGDLSQDPYLRPGDVITFNRVKRITSINGAVERPGTYQLLEGEGIRQLIEEYGGGFTSLANKDRLELTRRVNSTVAAGDKIFLSQDDFTNNISLEHMDEVFVPSNNDLQPVMFVEGAIQVGDSLTSANRITVRFLKGDTYDALVRRHSGWFTENSDTQNAFILRVNDRIPINLNLSLYDASYRGGVEILENDILIIPFRQYFISVAGAVVSPGRYPYIPDRDWSYYIGLAGGFVPNRNALKSVTITDFNGNRLNKTDIITPETTIYANDNHFLHNFNLYAPVITTIITIITGVFAVIALAAQ